MNFTSYPLLLIAIGLVGGLFGGMLGLGGGWLFGPALSIFGLTAIHAVGTSIAAMAAQSCVSAYRYHKRGRLRLRIGLSFGIFATLGLESGRQILYWLNERGVADLTLRSLYIAALLLIGWSIWPKAKMASGHPITVSEARTGTRLWLPGPRTLLYEGQQIPWLSLAFIGFVVGNLSGILGIGGGTVMVPLLAALYRMPMSLSVPTSLLSILCASTYGLLVNGLNGSIEIPYAAYLVIGAISGGHFGASLAIHADERLLKRLFSCLAWLTALSVSLRVANFTQAAFGVLLGGAGSLAALAIIQVLRAKETTVPR